MLGWFNAEATCASHFNRPGRGRLGTVGPPLPGVGCRLDGNLYTPVAGQPLTLLATLGSMGMGIPYFVLRYLVDYRGEWLLYYGEGDAGVGVLHGHQPG